MRTYILEKDSVVPLCVEDNNCYLNYITGEIIDDPDVLNLINNGLENKTFYRKKILVQIYAIVKYNLNNELEYVGYNYRINDKSNYLDLDRKPIQGTTERFLKDKIARGEFVQKLLWE